VKNKVDIQFSPQPFGKMLKPEKELEEWSAAL